MNETDVTLEGSNTIQYNSIRFLPFHILLSTLLKTNKNYV